MPVSPGQVLQGVILLTRQTPQGFDYRCQFETVGGALLQIENVQGLMWRVETLEAYYLQSCSDYYLQSCSDYYLQSCSDYPDAALTAMGDIAIRCGATTPDLVWTPVNAVTDCGQHCVVVDNSPISGKVDLSAYSPPLDCLALPAIIQALVREGGRIPEATGNELAANLKTCLALDQISQAEYALPLAELNSVGHPSAPPG